MKRILSVSLLAAALACTESNGIGRNSSVQVSFATRAAPAPLARVALGANQQDTIVVGSDTVILTEVKVVLREIELQPLNTPDCDGLDDDACEKFEAGPVLVTLPLTPGAQQQFALDSVPSGTYVEIEFDIHKPDDDNPRDQAFIAANPDFADISIRVRGTYRGTPFEFTTSLNVKQELALAPALVVREGTSTNVTILVDVATWFVVNGVLVNPTDPAVRSEIEENIKNSVEAFEDRDRNGSGDDD